ncbi:MAG: NADH-quinone oxidoreductase subunit C [Phycisphaerales bacterium]|nr:MAG: NADH-quinone oxidoreductase subunit C [Phycisphaerales bacterium]
MIREELDRRLAEVEEKLIGIERTRDNRIYLLCDAENVYSICQFLFDELALRFVISSGVDAEHCFEVLHHFSADACGCVVTVKAFIRDRAAPEIESITPLIPGAEWIEREMHDILGIHFKNHPNLQRLILHDDWPQGVYPLRKEVQL